MSHRGCDVPNHVKVGTTRGVFRFRCGHVERAGRKRHGTIHVADTDDLGRRIRTEDPEDILRHGLFDPGRGPARLCAVCLVDGHGRARLRRLPAREPLWVLPEHRGADCVLVVWLKGTGPCAIDSVRVQARRQQAEGSRNKSRWFIGRQVATNRPKTEIAVQPECSRKIRAWSPPTAPIASLALPTVPAPSLGHGRTIPGWYLLPIAVASNSWRRHHQVAAFVARAVYRIHHRQGGWQWARDSGDIIGKELKAEGTKKCECAVHGASCAVSTRCNGDTPAWHSLRRRANEVRIVIEGSEHSRGHAHGCSCAVADVNLSLTSHWSVVRRQPQRPTPLSRMRCRTPRSAQAAAPPPAQ